MRKSSKLRSDKAGVTIIEAIVGVSILSMIFAIGVAALMKAYALSAEARKHDLARNVANSVADQFLSLPYKMTAVDEDGDSVEVARPICAVTTGSDPEDNNQSASGPDPSGAGISWGSEDVESSGYTEITLIEGPNVESSVNDPNSDDVRAKVSRSVRLVENGQLGPLLEGTFTVSFVSGVKEGLDPNTNEPWEVSVSTTVARAVVR